MHVTTNPPHLLLLTILLLTTCGALGQQHPDGGCVPAERAALLSFKKGITIDITNRLASWHGRDCCKWTGVRCSSNETGRVLELRLRNEKTDLHRVPACEDDNALSGEISSSLLHLEQLEHMDLSGNCLVEYGKNIPSFLGSMKNLRYLNLSFIPSFGEVPPQLGNLSRLQYLDLGFNDPYSMKYSSDITWLKNLHSLQHLSMRHVNLSQISDWPQILNGIPSLRVIDFRDCSLESANQSLPHMNLTKLQKLDLSSNNFDHEISYCWFWKATSLKYLDISVHRFFGEFHDALENMSSLQVLDLSYSLHSRLLMKGLQNNLVMKGNYKNLCSLEILDLSDNGINGDINELMERLPQCTWDNLLELHLGDNNFTGTLPNLTGNFTNLIILDLSANNLIGSIPPELGYLSSLTALHLGNNHLNGTIPNKIGALTNLTSLDLSNNNLNGIITEEHFAGLISLKKLNLASNNLKVVVGAHWFPPFRLQNAHFASCPMGPLFPAWLQQQLEISELDLSSNALIDKIPNWFWQTFSLATDIDISNNQLSGTLPADLSGMSFLMLNLSSNQLTGKIPQFPRNITILDISRNSFSGPLPSIEAPQLKILLMFSNQIGGSIPESFCTLKELLDLDLSSNVLEGKIPHCFEFKDISFLQLSNNSLSGYFPAFLRKCTHLGFLDLGWNKFFGRLPDWIVEVNELQFLRLSHNIFSGNIPVEITYLNHLQYLDLSSNNISGVIPWHISNLTGMTKKGLQTPGLYAYPFGNETGYTTMVNQFEDVLSIITKGQQLKYGAGLAYYMGIDLSGNSLTGEIPSGITSLDALINLNLSSNYLSGKIPSKIGAMQSLESLDLSKNKIFGEIPVSLSNLTSLSYLNLSYNNLYGTIPRGRQLDTLNADNPSIMYIGNSGLCGPPLRKNCSGYDGYIHRDHRSNRQELDPMSFHLGAILGCVVGLWIVFCALLFKKTWRVSYFRLVDKLYDKVYVFAALSWASLSRNSDAE
ncbi:hypothetical protein SETIT_2G010100v2 [Setaria italica]|uniref:Leucine-rich repeat-containing N-terminal plant-type domain-containing protein n=1 Tax=Setaria italica TaxID=4555 RepID=K3ZZG4_SETIT|nr:hypothetical protein SETIT_2G010100v2 [Setaria italica]